MNIEYRISNLKASIVSINLPKCFLLFLLSFVNLISIAQPITITGKAERQANEMVRVIVYTDQFSHLTKTLASTQTDANGNFEIKLEIEKADYAFLAVGLKKGEFYLKPGAKYSFKILKDTVSEQRSVFDELPLQFILDANDQGLNSAIGDYNAFYNEFIYRNASRIYQGRQGKLIADYEMRAKMQFGKIKNPYFIDYMQYSFASLEWIGLRKKQNILHKYFANKPVLYNNIQYTDFFNDFMKAYLSSTEYFDYRDIIAAIKSTNALYTIDKMLKRDTLLATDQQLRALSTLLLLSRKIHNPDLPKGRVAELIEEIHSKNGDEKIRKIAGNFSRKLQKLQSGTPAPFFELEDAKGDTISLKQAEGKFVLLSFIRTDCRICLLQLEQLIGLEKKFANKLQNITIVHGSNYQKVIRYADSRLYDWPFLNLKKDILLLEEYEIKTYPTYAIINPDGSIAMIPAPMPDENLDIYLIRMMVQYEKK